MAGRMIRHSTVLAAALMFAAVGRSEEANRVDNSRPKPDLQARGASQQSMQQSGSTAPTGARQAEAGRRAFSAAYSEPDLSIVQWDREVVRTAARSRSRLVVEGFPLRTDLAVNLELEPFEIAGPDTQFVVGRKGRPDRPVDFDPSSISLFRGKVIGRAGSHVFLALGDDLATGYIDLGAGARRYQISSKGRWGEPLGAGRISVFVPVDAANLPPGVPLCGVEGHHPLGVPGTPGVHGASRERDGDGSTARTAPSVIRVKHMELAVDTDYEYFILFGDVVEATAYVYVAYAAVSDIYLRDVDTRVELVYARVWDDPDDLFNSGDPLPEFRQEWVANMGHVQRDAAQLFSGRRDYPFGGQAWLGVLCNYTYGYGVVGYVVGFLPDPSRPSPFNWDAAVTSHELGHTFAAPHTHAPGVDIDTCDDPNTTPQRGSIMSYCGQTWSGMKANTDNYFHTTIRRDHMGPHINASACIVGDCNMNNIDDAIDIANSTSDDTNGNGIPDECEDCNGNGVLDPDDIAGASFDKNNNGIPDECEPDCNNTTVPDDKDIADATSLDAYGNGIPDDCEEDCNNNGTSDYTEIQLDMPLDVDRNAVLDSCQDCDGDTVIDLEALDSAHGLWVTSGLPGGIIREFHATTGVRTNASGGAGSALVNQGQDLIVAPNGHVLVSSAGDDRVLEFDADGNYLGDLVTPGSGGLSYPTGLIMTPGGTLLVSSRDTHAVLAYNGTTGASMGAFVSAGSGGLAQPFGLTFGPGGNLFVTSATNEVLKYNGTTGAFIGKLVDAADNGTLDQPRGLTFKSDGNLLVASYGTDEVLEFDGETGASMGKWAHVGTATAITQDSPWGIRVGPNGHVYVSRTGTDYSSPASSNDDIGESHLTDARMYEYHACTGDFRKTHIGGNDHGLNYATGFAFVPGFAIDCNFNQLPDSCDITSGFSDDLNTNGTPDECEVDCNTNGQPDRQDIIPYGSSYDCNCNLTPDECDLSSGASADCDSNGVPDECEDCNFNGVGDACDISGETSFDCNGNGTPDECETALGTGEDCNANDVPDECDIASETSDDCQPDGVPDECQLAGVVIPPAIGACSPSADFGAPCCDDLESYAPGSIHGLNGWQGWGPDPGEPTVAGIVTTEENHTSGGSQSLKSVGHDTVRVFHGYDQNASPLWVFRAQVYIPQTMTGSAYLIALPDYDLVGGIITYSVQLEMGPGEVISDYYSGEELPLIRDQWVEIRLEIDYDVDSVAIFYDDVFLATHAWSVGGGSMQLSAVDIWSANSTAFYFDDLSLFIPFTTDCNVNEVPDECDISNGPSKDCNYNGIPDECELAAGISNDTNGVADLCECLISSPARLHACCPDQNYGGNMRYLSLVAGDPGHMQAIRVTFVDLPPGYEEWEGVQMWVGPPEFYCENAGQARKDDCSPGGPCGNCGSSPGLNREFEASTLQCAAAYRDWSAAEVINVFHKVLSPSGGAQENASDFIPSTYEIRLINEGCDTAVEESFSPALIVTMSKWGDTVAFFDNDARVWTPPDGVVDVTTDVTAILDKFKNVRDAMLTPRADIEPETPDQKINISDVTFALDGFRGQPYPPRVFAPPGPPECGP